MIMKALTLSSACALGLLAGHSAHAQAQVVNLNFGAVVGANVPNTNYDVDTDTTKQINFSTTTLLFNGSIGADQSFYGGFQLVGQGGNSVNQHRIQNSGTPSFQIAAPDGTTNGLETAKFIHMWDDTTSDFGGNNIFDATADSSFSFSSNQWLQSATPAGVVGGMQFVLRDSGSYYISNQQFGRDNFGGGFDATISGDTAGLEWAVFNPTGTGFTNYDASDSELGFGIVAADFSAQTFSNVEAVGYIAELGRFSGINGRVDDFSANLVAVPEPSSFALLAGMLALTGVMIRRRAR